MLADRAPHKTNAAMNDGAGDKRKKPGPQTKEWVVNPHGQPCESCGYKLSKLCAGGPGLAHPSPRPRHAVSHGIHWSCACFWARQGHSTAHRVGIVHPEPGRRPPGRRFVLHRTSGPRLRYAALSNPAFRPPRTRLTAAPARLHAAIPVPDAATTTTPALAALRRPFPPF